MASRNPNPSYPSDPRARQGAPARPQAYAARGAQPYRSSSQSAGRSNGRQNSSSYTSSSGGRRGYAPSYGQKADKPRRGGCMVWGLVVLLLLGAGVTGVFAALGIWYPSDAKVRMSVDVEAGSDSVSLDMFLKDPADTDNAAFLTDVSEIDLRALGAYPVQIQIERKTFTSTLHVVDTVAPAGTAMDAEIYAHYPLDAADLVTDIVDETDVTVSFASEPDLDVEGAHSVDILLTDEGNNKTRLTAQVTVLVDAEAPVIEGVEPVIAYIGEPVLYKASVKVSDNVDQDVELQVDNSQVDLKTEGEYPLTYKAVDKAGNEAEASTVVRVLEKPDSYADPDVIHAAADTLLAQICTDNMTPREKADAIYTWIRHNVHYRDSSDKTDWLQSAYRGLTVGKGDCFVFYSTSRELLTRAGIENMEVIRTDGHHYWNLINCGDGWYHFDTTPRQAGGWFFMWTDAQMDEYSKKHNNCFKRDMSLYPATPEE